MPLTDTTIRNAKPGARPVRLFDGHGLYLEVMPSGGKLWRLKYRFGGKEKRLALGAYPDVGLKGARERGNEARKLLADGIDPGENRKAKKAARKVLSRPDVAKNALLRAAIHIRRGEPLPHGLRDWLCDAIQSSLAMPGGDPHYIGLSLLAALGLDQHPKNEDERLEYAAMEASKVFGISPEQAKQIFLEKSAEKQNNPAIFWWGKLTT